MSSVPTLPGPGRPGTRRKETSESLAANGPLSPTTDKFFFKDVNVNTPPSLTRRRTGFNDDSIEKEEVKMTDQDSPFAGLRRAGTGGSALGAGANASSSTAWTPSTQSAFGGAFGAFGQDGVDLPDKRPGLGSARSASRFKDLLSRSSLEDAPSPTVKEKTSFVGLGRLPEEDVASHAMREQIRNRPNRSETNPYDETLSPPEGTAQTREDRGIEQMGFSAFRGHDRPQNHQSNEPLSPTNTNPYQSPQNSRMAALGEHDLRSDPPFGQRDTLMSESRRQPSFGPPRSQAATNPSGLGRAAGWDNPNFGSAALGRERTSGFGSAFSNSVFSPINDIQSPSGFGNGFFGGTTFGPTTRGSQLGPMFPPQMHESMRSESRNEPSDGAHDPFDAGRRQDAFRAPFSEGREEDHFGPPSQRQTPGVHSGHDGSQPESDDHTGMPVAQQRRMVMPDRMRWVYRDPHGVMQGPWSGLEMHDWFRAGFFSAELQVKKWEDDEWEPLAQLVRRIGNSREPFLVPQIGVPHGDSPVQDQFPVGPSGPTGQPPFANNFPSFGTTLTADQQNALERRKQEEQFLMARQKEYLTQRQMNMNTLYTPGSSHGQNLQHHASQHSLQSQPSYSSITSPAPYQHPPSQGPIGPSHHAQPFQSIGPPPSHDDLASPFGRMHMQDRGPFGMGPAGSQPFAAREQQRLDQDQIQHHETTFLGQQGRNERLEEFRELRGTADDDHNTTDVDDMLPPPIGSQRPLEHVAIHKEPGPIGKPRAELLPESLSLTQQVERTAAAQKQAREEFDSSDVPPVSVSPLPAPAAQRRGAPVAQTLAEESRSAVQTPVETPSTSLAPWAERQLEAQKQPSLKEIQEAEARRVAQENAVRAAQLKAQAERERVMLAAVPVTAPAPGLPTSSTWATASPNTPTTPGGSPWVKMAGVTPVPTAASAKKTLAQIQKEEETRKAKVAAQAAVSQAVVTSTNPNALIGSRYAQMVKTTSAPVPVASGSSAWTTVGTGGGKPKTPATVVATPAPRAVSSSVPSAPLPRPAVATRTTSTTAAASQSKAREEIFKWAKAQLGTNLKRGINLDEFVTVLMALPLEVDITSEAVYGAHETIDSRHFAEEIIRKRKLADKGVIEPAVVTPTTIGRSSNGGWSEVAKKSAAPAPKEETNEFKVIPKRKGKGNR